MCLSDPENLLLISTCKDKKELLNILNHLKTLNYEDRPDYEYIRSQVKVLREKSKYLLFEQEIAHNSDYCINNNSERLNNVCHHENKHNLTFQFTVENSQHEAQVNQNTGQGQPKSNVSILNFLFKFQLNNNASTASTFNNINLNKENVTMIESFFNKLNTSNNDTTIKQINLSKKRRRMSTNEEEIIPEAKPRKEGLKAFKNQSQSNLEDILQKKVKYDENIICPIPKRNNMIKMQDYELFIENIKHLKKK